VQPRLLKACWMMMQAGESWRVQTRVEKKKKKKKVFKKKKKKKHAYSRPILFFSASMIQFI